MTVCVGPEFTPDEQGRLRLRFCGGAAEQAWPYPCPPEQVNPLRVDPDCGLWLPPAARAAMVTASGATANVNTLVPAGFVAIDHPSITITNPSDCHPAVVLPFVEVDVFMDFPPGSDATAACRLAGNEYFQLTNPSPSGGSVMNTNHTQNLSLLAAAAIPAGGSQTYSWPLEVGQGSGGVRWRAGLWSIRALVLAGLS